MNAMTDLSLAEAEPRVAQRVELIAPTEFTLAADILPPAAANIAPLRPPSAVVSPLALLEAFLQRPEIDLDRAERLLQMGRDMRREEARLIFKAAFAEFKKLNIVVPRTKHVKQKAKGGGPGPNFWQSEYDVVAKILQPALAKFGFSYRFDPVIERHGNRAVWVSITCYLEHAGGSYFETATLGGPPDDTGAKNAQQESQSTITFWMRHTLLAVSGTAQAGNDNDGRGAQGYDDDEATEQQQVNDAPLLQMGRDASMSGMAPLTAWWRDLTEAQRERLMPEFGEMRKAARKADQAGNTVAAK